MSSPSTQTVTAPRAGRISDTRYIASTHHAHNASWAAILEKLCGEMKITLRFNIRQDLWGFHDFHVIDDCAL